MDLCVHSVTIRSHNVCLTSAGQCCELCVHSVTIRSHNVCLTSAGQCCELVRSDGKYFKLTSAFTATVSGRTYWRAVSTGNSRLRRVSPLPSEWLQIQELLFTLVLRRCTKEGFSHLWAVREREREGERERGRIGNVRDWIGEYPALRQISAFGGFA